MRRLLACAVVLTSSACSLLVDLTDLGPVDASSGDVTVDASDAADITDAADGSDASDASDGTSTCSGGTGPDANLFCDPSFEDPPTLAAPCGAAWMKSAIGTFTIWDAGHTGSQSCLICGIGGPAIHQTGPWTFGAGTVEISAWIAAAPFQSVGGATITAALKDVTDGGQTPVGGGELWSNVPTDGGWVQFAATTTTTNTNNSTASVYITLNSGQVKDAGACILLDDVSLTGP